MTSGVLLVYTMSTCIRVTFNYVYVLRIDGLGGRMVRWVLGTRPKGLRPD